MWVTMMQSHARQCFLHGGDARLRPGLNQCGHGSIDQKAGCHLFPTAEKSVDLCDARGDLGHGVVLGVGAGVVVVLEEARICCN